MLTVFDYYWYGVQNHNDTSQLNTIICGQLFVVSHLKQFLTMWPIYSLLMSLFFCIVANKVSHDCSLKTVVMWIFFLFQHYGFHNHRVTHFYMLWVHKNKVHGAFVFVIVAHH